MSSASLRDAMVVAQLPCWPASGEATAVPNDLVGAKIVAFGTIAAGYDIEGGGLVIDYIPRDLKEKRRLVLGFNELGMWIEYQGPGAG
jgi:hypothetical protein